MPTVRRVALALLALVAVLLWAAPASADPPARLATQVTDRVGALGAGRGSVDSALSRLLTDTGIQLFVVFVDSFDGTPAQQWTDRTAQLSDLGDRDALLAVATGDRSYAYSFPDDARITDAELADVAQNDIEPALRRGDWSGAVVAAADGYRSAAGTSVGRGFTGGVSWGVVLCPILLVIVGALIWVRARRRRVHAPPQPGSPAEPAGPPPVPTEELAGQANAMLIELDDDLRGSERELELAEAQYGREATAPFRAALDAARAGVAEAFRLRMTLEDTPAPDEPARRAVLEEIIELCHVADARLDAESENFDRLRDLEGRAGEVADDVDRRRVAVEAALPGAAAALQDLQRRYAGATVTAVAANVEQARERLRFAADAIQRARAALADAPGIDGAAPPAGPPPTPTPEAPAHPDRAAPDVTDGAGTAVPGARPAEAALAVRAGEQAVDQAEQLVAAISRAGTDLAAGRAAADAIVAEVASEIAAGRSALTDRGAIPPGLAAAVTGAEQTLAEVRELLSAPPVDPGFVVARLQAADAALDAALAEARDTAERTARARSVLAQALTVARAEVGAARDFITTRRGAVDAGARAALSEAQRHLTMAESLAESDPVTALAEAQQAQSLAANASDAARADVAGWGGYGDGYGRPGGFDSGSFAGAVLGGILAGGMRSGSYGGGWGGGFGGGGWGGGFGGSGSRGRRTGGGGGSRGGGGRF